MREPLRSISIWEPAHHDGEQVFVRPEPGAFGDHHAARRVIPQAKAPGTHRVCLFGESVAAGYLYAPRVTPAQVLERQLECWAADDRYEVIDFARTNETLASMVATVERSVQLEPETIVIFCGNNWNLLEAPEVSPYHPDGRREYGVALGEAGLMGPIEIAARRRLEAAGNALSDLDRIARAAGAEVIIVVPEVNLTDWESRQPCPWLPGDGVTQWHQSYEAATRALVAGNWEVALTHSGRMLDLDGGINPSASRLLAVAHSELGNGDLGRWAARHEVATDHAAVMCFLAAPRAALMDQEVLRRGARRHGFAVVDLPAVFEQASGPASSGRRMFLDYCHLTSEGTDIAMAAVGAAILGRTADQLLERAGSYPVPAEVEATARLGAAVHTAHRLLAVDPRNRIIDHWLGSALDASPGVESAMLDLVEARASRVPEVLTEAQQRNLASQFPLGYQHGWKHQHLDIMLIDAIGRVLSDRGRPQEDTVLGPLLGSHSLRNAPSEIAVPPTHLWEPLVCFYPDAMEFADITTRAFHRSPWPRTRGTFITDRSRTVRMAITSRVPRVPGSEARSGTARFAVNGSPIDTIPLNTDWSTHIVAIPLQLLRIGINEWTLDWPSVTLDGTAALRAAADRLANGVAADIHPVFGELFSVRAWVA